MRSFGVLFLLSIAFAPASRAGNHATNITSFRTPLPLVHVRTDGPAVERGVERKATVTVLDSGNNSALELLRAAPQLEATIKVRGYSSAKMSKKQYALEFAEEVAFLGLPAHEKWVLGAPYVDRALLRNELAFSLASSLTVAGKPWYAPRTRGFELYLNGQYQGYYLLTEKIDRSKNRLGLGKVNFDEPEQSPFMLEVEEGNDEDDHEYFVSDDEGRTQAFYYEPKPKKLEALRKQDPARYKRMKDHIHGRFNQFERAIRAIERGDRRSWRALVEPESFANFIVLQEIFKNLDGYRRSLYLHWKDGRFHMGPVWDFDLALGGIWVFGQRSARGFQVGHDKYIDRNPEWFWFRTLLKDPTFHAAVVKRYRQLRHPGQPLATGEIFRQMDAIAGRVAGARADKRNFTVWNWNGRGLKDGPIWLFVPKYGDFEYGGVVFEHKKWLLKRLEWLDEHFDEIGR